MNSTDTQPRVLIVMPDGPPARELVAFLGSLDFEPLWAKEGAAGFDIIDSEPLDGLICDLTGPAIDGFRLVQVGGERNPEICSIVIAGPEEIELGTEVMRKGAYDFQVRPVILGKIAAVLGRGLTHQRLVGEVSDLHRRLDDRYRVGRTVRRSGIWRRIYSQIDQVAQSRATVLLVGETGTGKGEAAKAIHQQSRRREQPFVEINSGALPEGIVESELFGHEKGAFTGATTSHKGRFELADEGTLLLDEVGDLSAATQVKLLRVIQSGEFERLGGTESRVVDVRLIAATNRDLESMVEAGTFRADLFYRLNVITIEVPPLRACRDDIPILVGEFVTQFSEENEKTIDGLTAAAMEALTAYDWPGNVRELKNCIEGMIVMSHGGGALDLADIPPHVRKNPATRIQEVIPPSGMTMKDVEKIVIAQTLRAVDFDRRKAASVLDIGLSTLYRKEKEYGLRQAESDSGEEA